MNILEPDSGNIPLVPPEEELSQLGQIPISGIEPEVDNPPLLLGEPIESPLAASANAVQTGGAIATNDNTDILTGLKEGDPNIPLEEEGLSLIEPRKKKKKDPGNNAKQALNLGKVGDDPIKYNDEIGIKSGKTTDKNDYYKFTLNGKENEVDIVVDGLKDNANVELLAKNGKTVLFKSAEKGKKAETINAELDKGTYYLRVFPQGKAKTKYGLSISAEEILKDPDSKPSGATNLGPLGKKKKTFSNEIGFKEKGSRDNSDFYKFTLTEQFNNLNIVLDGLKDDANIELLDKDGQTIIDQSRSKGKSREIIDGVLDAGSYYLKVEPQGSAKTKYQLSFDSDKIDDPDGTIKRADNLGSLGKKPKKNRGEIGFEVGGKRDQKDYYEFSLKKDSEVNLTLDGLNQNADLKLLGSKGNLLYSSTNKGKDVEQISSILEKGKYYALVEPVGGDRSEYTLTLDGDSNIKDPDAQLPGKTLGKLKAKPINKTDDIGLKKKGFVDTSDFWKFQLTKETDLSITLDRLSQNADLELYGKDGTTLIYSSKEKGKTPEEISAILDKGTYYVRVKPNSGSSSKYKLSVSGNTKIAEKDDELPGTNLGELGNKKITKKDRIGFESSRNVRDLGDFYNFSLAKKSGVNITLDGLSGDGKLSLLGTDGREIEVSNNKGNKNEVIAEILSPGNYYIGVEANGGDVKTKYNLGVTASLQKDDFDNRKNAKQLGTLNLQDRVTQKNRVGFTEGSIRDQVDFYSFKLTEASDVNLSLDGLDGNANLLLLDGKDTIDESTAKGLQAESIKKKLKPGTYYAAIFPASDAQTDYELTLEATQKTVDLASLKFEALDVRDGVKAGGKVKVNYRVNNIGNTKADAFEVGFYLSKDEGIDKSDRLLDTVEIKSLSGGKNTKKLAKQLTLPAGGDNFWQGSGDYYLGVIVDGQDAIAETNELNNTSSQRVGVDVSSDLILSGFDVEQKTVNPGQKFDAKVKVENGGGKLDDFRVGFYVSEDNEITTSDTFIGSKTIASLGGKKTTTINKQLTLPVGSVSGLKKYFAGAIADDQNVLSEVNETNNVSQEKVSLSPVPKDNAGNQLKKGRKVDALGEEVQKFSDWVGDFYGVSEDTHDYYKIQLDDRSRLNLNLKGLSANANLYLYDSDGTLVRESEKSGNKKEAISRKLLPGTYHALVWENDGGNTSYDLEMSASPLKYPVPQITGWNRDTALNIGAVGTTAIKKTEYVGNPHGFVDDLNDFYKFRVDGGGSEVQIDLTGLNANADLFLYDRKGSFLASSKTLEKVDEGIVKNLTPGTYFIEIQSINDAETTYNLQVVGTPLPNNGAGENPDKALDLETLAKQKTVKDWVGDIDDKDYYKFAVSENSTVEIGLKGMSDNANLELYDNKNKFISSSSETGNADEAIATNLSPGNYFIEVDNYSGVGTPYNLQLSATSRATDKAGNNFNRALNLGTLGAINQTEWVGNFDEKDFYKFTIASDSTAKLGLTGMNGNANITLYDKEQNRITSSSNSGNADEAIERNLEPGDYFVQVESSGFGADYNFTASATAIADAGGDTLETAGDMGDIVGAKTFSNWVGDVDDSDWYKFTLAGDSTVNLNLTDMTANANLLLYNSEGTSISSSSNYNEADEAIAINLNPGIYFARVDSSSGNTNYNFTASATAIPDSTGNSFETARDLGMVSTAQTISDWVGDLQYDDYYKFSVAPNSSVNLKLAGLSGNTGLDLYDRNEELIASSDNDGNADESIVYNLASGDTYYVRVDGRSPSYGGDNTYYNLGLSATPLAYSPANIVGNTEAQTKNIGALGAAQTFTDFVGNQYGIATDKNDFYQFTLGETSTVNLNLGGMTADADLVLLNGEYSRITESSQLTNVDEAITRNLLAGTYIAEAKSIENANTGYNLQLSATPHPDGAGEAFETARQVGTLAAPQTFNDWIGNVDENDYYQFAIDAVSTVSINLGGMSGDGNIELYDVAQNRLLSSRNTENADDVIVADLNPGTYYVQVWNPSGNFGTNYSLQLSPTVRVDNAGGADAPLDLGALTTANATNWVSPGIDSEDYYKFSVGQNSAVSLNLTGLSDDVGFNLYNSTMEEIASASNDSNTETAIAKNLTPGTYFVEVSNFRDNGTEYNFAASATALVDTAGNAFETARDLGAISATQTFADWVGGIDRADYYKFNVAQNSAVNLNLTGLAANANLYLYDSNQDEILRSTNDDAANEAISSNLPTGTYYALVDRSSGDTNYNLGLSATPLTYSPANLVGNTEAQTKNIGALGAAQTFTDFVGSQYDIATDKNDFYQFTLAEDATVSVSLGGLTANADLTLRNSEYSRITDSTNFSNLGEAITRNLVAGTYIAEAKSIDDANTGYNVQLSAVAHPDAAGETFDTARSVGNLTATQTFSDWVGNIDDDDYYQFTLDANRTVNIQLSGVSDEVDIQFFDSSGNWIYDDINGTDIDPWMDVAPGGTASISGVLAPGVYFVKVSDNSFDGSFGTNYSLSMSAS